TKLEEVEALHAATKLPLMTGSHIPDPKAPNAVDEKRLAANGMRFVSPGYLGMWAAMKAEYDVMKAQREGKTQSELMPGVAAQELITQIIRQSDYNDWIERFLNE